MKNIGIKIIMVIICITYTSSSRSKLKKKYKNICDKNTNKLKKIRILILFCLPKSIVKIRTNVCKN